MFAIFKNREIKVLGGQVICILTNISNTQTAKMQKPPAEHVPTPPWLDQHPFHISWGNPDRQQDLLARRRRGLSPGCSPSPRQTLRVCTVLFPLLISFASVYPDPESCSQPVGWCSPVAELYL